MQLKNIYKSDINRPINGVIKMAQNDEESIKQELCEYVITKELRKHFSAFFNSYERSISTPTDKIGVWISGFFGSGKSHFLKMLSYLLSNQVVAGKSSVEYFSDKFDDPMMLAQVERCTKVPTDTILFNIDAKGPINKDKTAVFKVFAKVFYEHCGFYGEDFKVAKLEQFISKSGKMDEFKQKFEEINGDDWENARSTIAFFEDDIVEALIATLGISETAARNWFNGTETSEMSIEVLVREIKEYVESRGKNYRLLFMIDEVGQYIGSDSDLMINLQTIVEEIGTHCGGRVWVMVTSQEAIDSITKISGDDFSKIQGRFNTRISLSSSSVDEVIKKRILAKTENAENMLKLSYEKNSAVLKNLFTFNGAVLDLKGYSGEGEFVESYPFVPYQFRLVQNVFTQVRRHGNAGKHIANGERSMLSGFQEAAQVIQDKDENALVPFALFYDTLNTFLESSIRRVIDRCQSAADSGTALIEQYDVSILKLLYLIRYVDDIKSNVDNITTLMVDDIRADKIVMRRQVQEALDRLLSQNYIARNGDTYAFLTDDEQDIARDIRRTDVDSAMIVQTIAQTIFGEVYPSKKFRYSDKCDFSYDQIVDDTVVGQLTGAMRMRFVTVASDMYASGDQMMLLKSQTNNEAIILLSDAYPYFEELENAMKIRKYIKGRNVAQLPESIQNIIRGRQQQASAHEKRAKEYLADAILNAKIYVAGDIMQSKHSSVKDKLDTAMTLLVESVYTKLSYVKKNYDSDAEIWNILNSPKQQTIAGIASPNIEALEEIEQYLEMQSVKLLPTSMGDIQKRFSGIPYGWREIDIAALVANLMSDAKVTIHYAGNQVRADDRRVVDYLRRRSEVEKTSVKRRVAIADYLMKNAREFLREYFGAMDIPTDEDSLIAYVLRGFEDTKGKLQTLLGEYTYTKYPDRSVVEAGIKLCDLILSQKKDNTSLLTTMVNKQDDLLDNMEDMTAVWAFFKNQKPIYDSAVRFVSKMLGEKEYLQVEEDAIRKVNEIKQILDSDKPYKRISALPTLMEEVKEVYSGLLELKKSEVIAEVQSAMGEIHQAMTRHDQKPIIERADKALVDKREAAKEAETITELDAMRIQISNIRAQYLRALMVDDQPHVKSVSIARVAVCFTAKLENEKDIDEYLARVKDKLMSSLEGNDVIHII